MAKAKVLHRDEIRIPESTTSQSKVQAVDEDPRLFKVSKTSPDWDAIDIRQSNTWGNGRAYVPTRSQSHRVAGGSIPRRFGSRKSLRQRLVNRWRNFCRTVRNVAESPGGTLVSISVLILTFGLSPLVINYSAEVPDNPPTNVTAVSPNVSSGAATASVAVSQAYDTHP